MNAVLYMRFSPRPKDKADNSASIEVQETRCRAYSKAYGWKVLSKYVFRDPEVSGKDIEHRPLLQNAIDAACATKGVLVVYSLDRLSRSVVDSIGVVDRLRKAGAQLASVTQSVDTGNPSGWLMFTILAAFAEYERLVIAQRTSAGMKHRQANGEKMSAEAPYGLKVDPDDPKQIIPDPQEQIVISVIRGLYRSGDSLREICRLLNEAGYKPRGKSWHHGTISRILKREGVR